MVKRETQTKKRAAKKKKVRAKKESFKAAAKRRGLQREFEDLLDLQNAKVKALAKTVGTVWHNQVALSESIDRIEEEFCVLGRLMIPKMNEILIALGSEDLITEEMINGVFLTWNEFKKRPDFKAHFVPWFLGVPLNELPPPPEVKQEENPDTPAPEGEGAEVFGGDYGEGQTSTDGDEATQEVGRALHEASTTHEVPPVQDVDDPVLGTEQSGGTEVPEVPDRV
jgi:hypothetical protein